jgi:hypothetical protein
MPHRGHGCGGIQEWIEVQMLLLGTTVKPSKKWIEVQMLLLGTTVKPSKKWIEVPMLLLGTTVRLSKNGSRSKCSSWARR